MLHYMNLCERGGTLVRAAQAEDVEKIYALKVEAFGKTSLPFTIYQSPKTVKYLRKLVNEQDDASSNHFFVAEQRGQIAGYYHAVSRYDRFILNYIAVSLEARGQGLGSALLAHFEDLGARFGHSKLALDVFSDNVRVKEWYLAQGYQAISSCFHVLVDLNLLPYSRSNLSWNEDAWQRALKNEEEWGFSKLQGYSGSCELSIGLIGGSRCKLLEHTMMSVEAAVEAVASRLALHRAELILSGLENVSEQWPILKQNQVFQLVKCTK